MGGSCAVIAAPEVRRLRMRPGDAAIILASDGLWDVMDDCEAVDIVEKVRRAAVANLGFRVMLAIFGVCRPVGRRRSLRVCGHFAEGEEHHSAKVVSCDRLSFWRHGQSCKSTTLHVEKIKVA